MITSISEKQNAERKSLGRRGPSESVHMEKVLATQEEFSPSEKVMENFVALKKELDAVQGQHGRLQQAIYEAAQIQRRLCAPRELIWGEFEVAGEIFPVRHLSGDFFKVMELGSMLGLAVGDIAGKGMTAGIWQAHLMHLVERAARAFEQAADVVAEVNRELCREQSEPPPITALFFARLDPERNELSYCSAGLPDPLVVRRNKSVERLQVGGPMLGALKDAAYNSGHVCLNPGDMLLAYSDGLTESRNAQDEEFEMARLSTAANAVNGASANQVLFSTLGAVLDFADSCSPADDLTLLVVRHREHAPAKQTSAGNKDLSTLGDRLPSTGRPRQERKRKAVS
ncbi:MAG: PP2C family protein-serine/threonine phosphatase [Candidatus Acidiferrum sp.]